MGEKLFVPELWVIMRQKSLLLAAQLSEKWLVFFIGVVLCERGMTNIPIFGKFGGDSERSNNFSNFCISRWRSIMWKIFWLSTLSILTQTVVFQLLQVFILKPPPPPLCWNQDVLIQIRWRAVTQYGSSYRLRVDLRPSCTVWMYLKFKAI